MSFYPLMVFSSSYDALFSPKPVSRIVVNGGRADGVVLEDGSEIRARAVLSNATPQITFLDLLPKVG